MPEKQYANENTLSLAWLIFFDSGFLGAGDSLPHP